MTVLSHLYTKEGDQVFVDTAAVKSVVFSKITDDETRTSAERYAKVTYVDGTEKTFYANRSYVKAFQETTWPKVEVAKAE
jgi:hypothetical protein